MPAADLSALVIGADSRIGEALLVHLKKKYMASGTSRRVNSNHHYFNLAWSTTKRLPWAQVNYICGGITSFKQSMEEEDLARLTNVVGVCKTTKSLIRGKRKVVFLSSCSATLHTDHIHGRLKKEAEDALLSLGPLVAVVRLGPVKFPGRVCYSDGPYQPLELDRVVEILASYMEKWEGGLRPVFNGNVEHAA